MINTYLAWAGGAPEETRQALEKLRANRDVAGDYELSLVFSLDGRPYPEAEKGMCLFAERCMPEWIKTWAQLPQLAVSRSR